MRFGVTLIKGICITDMWPISFMNIGPGTVWSNPLDPYEHETTLSLAPTIESASHHVGAIIA